MRYLGTRSRPRGDKLISQSQPPAPGDNAALDQPFAQCGTIHCKYHYTLKAKSYHIRECTQYTRTTYLMYHMGPSSFEQR